MEVFTTDMIGGTLDQYTLEVLSNEVYMQGDTIIANDMLGSKKIMGLPSDLEIKKARAKHTDIQRGYDKDGKSGYETIRDLVGIIISLGGRDINCTKKALTALKAYRNAGLEEINILASVRATP